MAAHTRPGPMLWVLLLLAGCATSTEGFVESMPGRAVTKGRVVRIEGLSAQEIRFLSDGTALTVDAPAQITLEFSDGTRRELRLRPGAVLVIGGEVDYVVRREDRARSDP